MTVKLDSMIIIVAYTITIVCLLYFIVVHNLPLSKMLGFGPAIFMRR